MTNLKTIQISALATLLFLPLCSFAQAQNTKEDTRVEVNFKQRHSSKQADNLYADGIKIKRDLSLIKEAQEERVLDMDEIPSDELYGGIWSNKNVNIYGAVENIPETFNVDLSNFSMPTMGYVTSNYGWRSRWRRHHHGIDLKVQTGDTIYAAFDGKVRVCDYERRGYGYYVVLRHPNGLETVYGHLSHFLVSDNEVVRSGQPIALGGSTGRSTGSHLHFELRFLGRSINPADVIDFENKVCHKDKYMVSLSNLPKTGQQYSNARMASTYSPQKGSNKYAKGEVKYYRIKKGDTLSKIAQAFGISIQKLCSLNSMRTGEKLRVGKSLRVS
jgi:murein DD-endopeptidase MepM/ murein hydrolase activator NlpD